MNPAPIRKTLVDGIVSNALQQIARVANAHLEIIDPLLPGRLSFRSRRCGFGRPLLGDRKKATELPRRRLAPVVPELGIVDRMNSRIRGNEILEDDWHAGLRLDELPDPSIDVDVPLAHVHPSNRNPL